MVDAFWTAVIFLAGTCYGGFFALWLCSCDDRALPHSRSGYRPRRNMMRVSPPLKTLGVPVKPVAAPQLATSGVTRTVELPRAAR
jgi:hypothetical protein